MRRADGPSVRLEIVGPGFWRPEVEKSLQDVGTSDGLGLAILRAMHSRQCGVPPALCVSFAEFLNGNLCGLWEPIHRELDAQEVLRGKALHSCAPYELVRLLFAPIMLAAQRMLMPPVAVIFGGPGYPDRVSESNFSYSDYAREFCERAYEIARQHAAPLRNGASQAQARDLRQGFLAVAARQILRRGIGRIDETGLDLFFEAHDPLAETRQPEARTRDVRHSTARGGRKPQQDGVVGLRKEHSVEALSGLVPGQLAGPPVLVAQRLFEEGVLVFDRPPPTDDPSEVLLLALVPDAVESLALSTLRAAWWLFAWRATELLRRRRYENVRVVWLQGVYGEPRVAELETQDHAGGWAAIHADRGRLLAALKCGSNRIEAFARARAALSAEAPPGPTQVVAALEPLLGAPGTGEVRLGVQSERLELDLFDEVFAVTVVGMDHTGPDDDGAVRQTLDLVSPVLANGRLIRSGCAGDGTQGFSVSGGETYDLRGGRDDARIAASRLAGQWLGDCLDWVTRQASA